MGELNRFSLNEQDSAERGFGDRAIGHELEFSQVSHFTPIVFVVDDDPSVPESLGALIRSAGGQPKTSASAGKFLDDSRALVPCCLVAVLDLDDLQLQKCLPVERANLPIFVAPSCSEVREAVQATKTEAVDFATKLFNDEGFLTAIRRAIERNRLALIHETGAKELRNRYASLTPRERQVMALVVSGLLNKQVGGELGISEITVKAHRGQVMQKMKANSVADLVKMALRLHLTELS